MTKLSRNPHVPPSSFMFQKMWPVATNRYWRKIKNRDQFYKKKIIKIKKIADILKSCSFDPNVLSLVEFNTNNLIILDLGIRPHRKN